MPQWEQFLDDLRLVDENVKVRVKRMDNGDGVVRISRFKAVNKETIVEEWT